MSLLKKLLFSFLASLVIFVSVAPYFTVSAASPTPAPQAPTWYDQSFTDWFGKVYDSTNPSEIFGERYTAAQVQWIVYSLFSMIVPGKPFIACVMNGDITTCVKQVFSDAQLQPNLAQKPKQSFLSLVFASDRPISFISYTKNVASNFSLVSEVHAQSTGFGFNQLNIIQSLWASVRNAVYGLFVILAIILAFMIMFRVKINPQTVITVQSAIPKLILAIIFVTFSYAIAGLMIDLMYVVIGFFSLILANSGNFFINNATTIFSFLTTGGPTNAVLPIGIAGLFLLHTIMFSTILFVALLAQNGGVLAAITSVLTLGLWPAILAFLSLIVFVILAIVELIAFFKVMWMLIKTFAQFLLTVIFGPFQIALGVVIPGMGMGAWLKSMLSQLAVFPLTGILLAMSFVFLFLATSATNSALGNISVWDLLGIINPGLGASIANTQLATGWPPLLNGPRGMLALIYLGVSLILITLIPKSVEIIQGFITGRPFAYGTAIGEAVGLPLGLGRAGLAAGVGRIEEQRERTAREAGATYQPAWYTQALRTAGVIKGH